MRSRPPEPASPEAARDRNAADPRARAVAAGLDFLEAWLADLVRQGLGAPAVRDPATWEAAARRLVDAKAPGLARRLRMAGDLTASGEGWESRLLEHLGRLALAVHAMRHEDTLPDPLRADLRAVVGWTTPRAEVLAGPLTHDRWRVVGRRDLPEPNLRARRTWLVGEATGRPAALLEHGPAHASLPTTLWPGTAFDGALAFYPGAVALRAVVHDLSPAPADWSLPLGAADFDDALAGHARLLARSPWVEASLMVVRDVTADLAPHLVLRDAAGATLPVLPGHAGAFTLAAASGGHPMSLAAEWDGASLRPLATWSHGTWTSLEGAP